MRNPHALAFISFILCLPLAFIFVVAFFDLEPLAGMMKSMTTIDGQKLSMLGRIIMLGAFGLLPVALVLNLMPVLRARSEGNVRAHPINLLLGASILLAILWIAGAIIVDQMPCWRGVPNCD